MNNISKHISYKEATRSNTAIRYGISNHPDGKQLSNMRRTAMKIFEPARRHFGVPIFVSSFFRHPKLNEKVGGSSTSDHIEGNAIDMDDVLGGVKNSEIFYFILDNLEFKRLIWEFGDDEEPNWVHASYVPNKNRKEVIKAVRYTNWLGQKKTKYVPFIDKRKNKT